MSKIPYDDGTGGYFKLPYLDYHMFLDHFQTRKNKDGKLEYISQPYDPLDEDDFKHMIEVCDKHNIGFKVRANSDHLPGRTLLIEWYRKKE